MSDHRGTTRWPIPKPNGNGPYYATLISVTLIVITLITTFGGHR